MSTSLDEVQEARGGVLATVPASAARTLFVGLFRILLVLLSSQLFALSLLGPPSSAMAALPAPPAQQQRTAQRRPRRPDDPIMDEE